MGQVSRKFIGVVDTGAELHLSTYFTNIEPPSGSAISQILPQALIPYM